MNVADFFDHKEHVIQSCAHQIAEYQTQLARNEITQEEYDDLVQSLLSVDKINKLMDNVEDKKLVQAGFDALLTAAMFVPI